MANKIEKLFKRSLERYFC